MTADSPAVSQPPAKRSSSLWLAWERHRRSRELAAAFGAPLREIVFGGPRPLRHLLAGATTLAALARSRPRVLFVQNPSVFLAALAVAVRPLFHYVLVVDRHSNFRFDDTDAGLFNLISNYSLRRADLTIVTNDSVAALVEAKGGRAFVLPDRLPRLMPGPSRPLAGRFNVVFVCTYSADEPYLQVIDAARRLAPDIHLYVTGNSARLPARVRRGAPANLTFTGFIPAADYETLLGAADAVMALTDRHHTLLCGAYEAVSLGKPLVTSSTAALAAYFRQGSIRTVHDPDAIAAALVRARDECRSLRVEIAALRSQLRADWDVRFAALSSRLAELERHPDGAAAPAGDVSSAT